MSYLPSTFLALLLALTPAALFAQPIEKVTIKLQPVKEPRPALKHRLYPEALELRPGNAATQYNKALLMMPGDKESKDLLVKADEWTNLPIDKFPKDEAKKLLQRFSGAMGQAELASLRDTCDWGLPIREADNPFMILLPEIQEMRNLARLFIYQARLEVAEKKFEKALGTFRTTILMARHVSQAPTLINALVGMAILGMVDKGLEEMISQPGAPSIYWAVTSLPPQMFDLQQAMELDANSIYLVFPDLYAARNKKLSDSEWKSLHEKVQKKMARLAREFVALGTQENPWNAAVQAAQSVRAMATAKPRLIEFGYKAEEVEAMPVDKLVLLHDMLVYEDFRDEMLRWFSIPYHQIGEGVKKFEQRLKEGTTTIVVVSPQLLLPAIHSVRKAHARSERRLAALRILDALRLQADSNGGKLPEKLSDIKIVPVPDNPATGKPFDYSLSGGVATLQAAGPNPVEYTIEGGK